VEDCTASYSEEPHQATLANIRRAFGRVVTAEEVASVWRAAELLPKVAAAVTTRSPGSRRSWWRSRGAAFTRWRSRARCSVAT
jgi:hypothetical protein